jgi:polysaccharide deacetylase 2 family uncharacterized protein YibQ
MIRAAALLACLIYVPAGFAATPVIAVVIDDLGNNLAEGKRAAALPGPVACSILPLTQHARQIAGLAHAANKEVLLHLPMESVEEMPLGPGAITLDMDETEIKQTVMDDLAAIPHVAGVNNHEGSLITRHPGDLAWIMQALHAAGNYFYLDSYTTDESVAYQVAREQGVPAARRNVFLDDVDSEAAVRAEWRRLLAMARKHGFALGIGHPKAVTLSVLEDVLSRLDEEKVELVPVSRIVELQAAHPLPWPASDTPPSAAARH